MNYKVVLDPARGGNDFGATYFGRREKDDTLRLAMTVGRILENEGVEVVYTRTSDIYLTPSQRAEIANTSQADFMVSIHRNSSLIPNIASGVESIVISNEGIPGLLANNINEALEMTGFANLGVIERPGLLLLRRTEIPAVLVQVGFIDNIADNMLFDENFDAIAFAIADSILTTLREDESMQQTLYRVQVGAFRSSDNAKRLLSQLLAQGFPAFIIYDDGFYKVQVGAFEIMDNAIRMEQTLREYGYYTFITTR